jgi:hypothetical protein
MARRDPPSRCCLCVCVSVRVCVCLCVSVCVWLLRASAAWLAWQICGPSGSAKSVLLRLHFGPPRQLRWQRDPELPLIHELRQAVSAAQAAVAGRAEGEGSAGIREVGPACLPASQHGQDLGGRDTMCLRLCLLKRVVCL